MGTISHRVTRVIFWVVIYLIFLEAVLSLGGWIFTTGQRIQNSKKINREGIYKIICLGDSNTALGAEDAYPVQLEQILNERTGSKKFQVINEGIPAADSAIIMDAIEEKLDRTKPDMVIVMMGANDKYAPKPHESRDDPFPALRSLKIYKLSLGVFKNIKEHFQPVRQAAAPPPPVKLQDRKPVPRQYAELLMAGIKAKEQGAYDTAEKIFVALLNVPDLDHNFQLRVSREASECFERQKKLEKMLAAMKYYLDEDEFDVGSINVIRSLCLQKEGLPIIIDFLSQQTKKWPESVPLHGLLGACYAQNGQHALAEAHLEIVKKIRAKGDILPLKHNYIKLHKLLRQRGIQGVYVQYPLRRVENLTRLLSGEEDYDSMLFVDNEELFKEALDPAKYHDYFMDRNYDDMGHCTRRGNHMLASHIADTILKKLGYD